MTADSKAAYEPATEPPYIDAEDCPVDPCWRCCACWDCGVIRAHAPHCPDRGVGYEGTHGLGCGCNDPAESAPEVTP